MRLVASSFETRVSPFFEVRVPPVLIEAGVPPVFLRPESPPLCV